jgi:uncharacterized membrane protein
MTELVAFAALVFALIAWHRDRGSRPLQDRVQRLEHQVAHLRQRLESAPASGEPRFAADAPPPVAADAPPPAPAPLAAATSELVAAAVARKVAAAEAPPAAPRSSEAPRTPPPPRAPVVPAIDWERWLGVRGFAVLGGIVLAMAGLYLFRYSIEHGWISPAMRVAMGLVAGAASLAVGEWRLRERYGGTADALSGAGFAILYASLWAARARYGLVGTGTAFVAMACVTAACTWLSARRSSLLIAALGLAGGFATPLLVASQADHPIGLFGYLLILDLALLVLAERRGWPALGLLSLVATTLYQISWVAWRMGPGELWIGFGVLASFAVAFSFVGGGAKGRTRTLTEAGGVLFPFAITFYLAASARFGTHLWRTAALLALLAAAAGVVARRERAPVLASAAAASAVAVVAAWCATRILDPGLAVELAVIACGLAALFHVFCERDEASGGTAAYVAALGFLAVMVLGVGRAAPLLLPPWIAAWVVLAALLVRQGTFADRGWLATAAAIATALGFWRLSVSEQPPAVLVLCAFGVAVLFQGAAIVQRGASRPAAEHAAATFAILAAAPLLVPRFLREASWILLLDAALVHGLLAAMVARRLGRGDWTLAGLVVAAGIQTVWTDQRVDAQTVAAVHGAFALQLASALLFAAFPFLAGDRYARNAAACWASALALPAWFPSLHELFVTSFGSAAIGVLPLGLAAVAFGAAGYTRARSPADDPAGRRMLILQLAVALGFVTAAIPLQLEHEWITIAWALEGTALVWLWRRFDHPGLKLAALLLFTAVTIRLVANPAVFGYEERGWPVFNWLLYTYLVPAASLLAASRWLAQLELARVRPGERPLYGDGIPLGAVATGAAALVVIFVWINLTVFDAFGRERTLTLDFSREPARDLTLSLAWAAYGLALLAAGVWRRLRPLRWASLALVLLTVGKVFLYDLGELRDLYRVASLFGLAVSLILVSWAYQRFVRRADAEGALSGDGLN